MMTYVSDNYTSYSAPSRLSHEKVTHMDSPVLKSINEGYRFFVNWINHVHSKGKIFRNVCYYLVHY